MKLAEAKLGDILQDRDGAVWLIGKAKARCVYDPETEPGGDCDAVKQKPPTVRGIRAILRKAGVPLCEFKSDVKRGPRHLTEGADVYSLKGREGMLLHVVTEWCDGRMQSRKLPAEVHAALDAAGYAVDAHGLVDFKVTP